MDDEAKAESRSPEVEPPSRAAAWKSRLGRLKGPLVAVAAVGTILGGLAGYWNGWRAVRSGMAEANISPSKPGDAWTPQAASDRRMTFSVLPFQAPTGDADGARLALAAFELLQSAQEAKVLWGSVVPRTLVEQQVARPQTLGQLGRALDVHFLYRGNVTRSESGHALELAVIDVATERVLSQRSIKVPASADGPQLPAEAIRNAAGWMTYYAVAQEVARARDKPDAQLDVRDLAFRAKVDWNSDSPDRAAVYAKVIQSLDRARTLAPDDLLTLKLTAQVDLCECLKAWAADNRPMEEIGVAALDRYLTLQPVSDEMLELRFWHLIKRGQHREAPLVNDTRLAKLPDDGDVLLERLIVLRYMGEIEQAVPWIPRVMKASDGVATESAAAAVYFAHGDDAQAALLGRKAVVHMTRSERSDPAWGVAALVLVGAESRAGRLDQARRALQDFQEAVPNSKTIGQIKAWLQPSWVVPGGDAFWQALQNAGVAG